MTQVERYSSSEEAVMIRWTKGKKKIKLCYKYKNLSHVKFDCTLLNLEFSQKRIENENLILKEKCESLINENIMFSKNISCTKITKCTHCNYHGHSLNTCPIRRKVLYKFRQVWVSKQTKDLVTNSQGSKAGTKIEVIVSCRCAKARSYKVMVGY